MRLSPRKRDGDVGDQEAISSSDPNVGIRGSRVLGIDAVKFIASVGIVALHMGSKVAANNPALIFGPLVIAAFRWGVPVFFIAAGYLQARGMSKSSGAAWLRRRAVRLYGIYAIWTVIYLVAGTFVEPGHRVSLSGLLLFGGGEFGFHLWFLPVLIATSAVGVLLKSKVARIACLAVCMSLVFARLGGWMLPGDALLGSGAPFSHWLLLYCAGMLLNDYRPSVCGARFRYSSPVSVGLFALSGAALLAIVDFSMRTDAYTLRAVTVFGIASAIALVMFVLGLNLSLPLKSRVSSVFGFSLGVYLIHPMARAAFGRILPLGSMDPVVWMALGFLVVLGLSMGVTALMRLQRVTKWLVS